MNSKLSIGTLMAAVLVSGSVFAQELETEEQKIGYIIGMDIGNSLRTQGTVVDLDTLFDALRTVYEGGVPLLTTQQSQEIRDGFIAKRKEVVKAEADAVSSVNLAEGEAFLAENKTKDGVQVTASGLQYKVLSDGTGANPVASDTVEVHYRGTLLDGTEFDSSYKRSQSATFPLTGVIAGWTEGVQLMPVGSKYEFYIKPELAYGAGGRPSIPPNSTLIFQIELVSIQGSE